ncbi:MAG: hypothetical protein ACJA16_005765, partial [Akkermansiaceae bacterium]
KEDLPLLEDFPLERAVILPEWNYQCHPSNYYGNLN